MFCLLCFCFVFKSASYISALALRASRDTLGKHTHGAEDAGKAVAQTFTA